MQRFPTTLDTSGRGGIITPEVAAEAQALHGQARVVTIAAAGHAVRADNPAAFAHAVAGFLTQQLADQSSTAS